MRGPASLGVRAFVCVYFVTPGDTAIESLSLNIQAKRFLFFLFQSAVGHDYHAKLQKHASQEDYSKGFGGRYGIEKDRQDKVCV